MAKATRQRGFEYFGVADHSKSAHYAGGLSLADSDEVAQAYRYEVARGFRDDVAHLSDLISPSGEAFWPAGSLASVKPRGQSGIATSTCFSSSAVAVGMWATRLRCPSAAACPQRHGLKSFGRIAGFGAGSHR
ncbi:hypothetical protein [Bradyrhizobium canariense]|uniref:hypothetical protein n=1 Tax=Bradyrhizobium canariense TaxID=255045 RepID=UPI001CA574F4|nr:hypothetical protein [Bradyrhizobium canariense]